MVEVTSDGRQSEGAEERAREEADTGSTNFEGKGMAIEYESAAEIVPEDG